MEFLHTFQLRFAVHLCPRGTVDRYVPLQVSLDETGANVQGLETSHLLPLLGTSFGGELEHVWLRWLGWLMPTGSHEAELSGWVPFHQGILRERGEVLMLFGDYGEASWTKCGPFKFCGGVKQASLPQKSQKVMIPLNKFQISSWCIDQFTLVIRIIQVKNIEKLR